jgi:hypothetical protein
VINPTVLIKELYTRIVTLACLLFFTQCSSQASLSDDIEALKKQLQEIKDSPPGGGQGSQGGLEQRIQDVNAGLEQQIQQVVATANELEESIDAWKGDFEKKIKLVSAAIGHAGEMLEILLQAERKKERKIALQSPDPLAPYESETSKSLTRWSDCLLFEVKKLKKLVETTEIPTEISTPTSQ